MSGMKHGETPGRTGAALARTAMFFAFWLAISGWKTADLPVGLAAAAAAAWTSLALRPAKGVRLRLRALTELILHFFRGSILAGFDVARRALRRDLDLNPGFVAAPLHLPEGNARNAFCALASLAPGSLPVGMEAGSLLVHALDVKQPIVRDLSEQETLFMRTLGDG